MKLWDLYKDKQDFIGPSLERIKKACQYIGNPQKMFQSILVGGTNGKGSTCAFIERILREEGFKTGWFVSPHLLDERERWRIRGKLINEEILSYYVKDLKSIFERFNLTYFEACTLLAIKYFSDEGIDIGIFEVGMGGRWDATKVVNPEIVILTNVGRDHTKWLGDTIEDIARDKLHLYVKGKPFIIGEFRYPIADFLNLSSDIIIGGYDFCCEGFVKREKTILNKYLFEGYKLKSSPLGMWGKWQITNASLAVTSVLKTVNVKEENLRKGLEKAKMEGRMEIIREKPLLMVDCAHNSHAVGKVVKEVCKHFGKIRIVFSSLTDKDWLSSLRIIRTYTEVIYLCKIKHHRAERIDNLLREAKTLGFKRIHVLDSPSEILHINSDLLCVGSIYFIGDVKGMLKL